MILSFLFFQLHLGQLQDWLLTRVKVEQYKGNWKWCYSLCLNDTYKRLSGHKCIQWTVEARGKDRRSTFQKQRGMNVSFSSKSLTRFTAFQLNGKRRGRESESEAALYSSSAISGQSITLWLNENRREGKNWVNFSLVAPSILIRKWYILLLSYTKVHSFIRITC